MSSAGIMNPAFFSSKSELLQWVNSKFEMDYNKVEQSCTGALHCQILDSIFPGKVPLHKVNFHATQEYQFVQNFKILQKVFNKENIPKHVEVERLVKGKYQDNLEMLQWMKHFWETRYNGDETYEAKSRRTQAIARFEGGRKKALRTRATDAKKASSSTTTDSKENLAPSNSNNPPATKPKATANRTPAQRTVPAARVTRRAPTTNNNKTSSSSAASQSEKLSSQNKALRGQVTGLEEQLAQLRITVEGLEKERDFYYNKLREVEILCSAEEENPESSDHDKVFVKKVLDILYKEDEDFHQPEQPEAEQAESAAAPQEQQQDAKDEQQTDAVAEA